MSGAWGVTAAAVILVWGALLLPFPEALAPGGVALLLVAGEATRKARVIRGRRKR